MSDILNFSPAESLMLLSPINSSGKAMIRVTLLELILLNRIKVKREVVLVDKTTNVKSKYYYIYKGDSVKEPKPHQKLILDFVETKGKVSLQNLVKYVINESGGFHDFKMKFVFRPLVEKKLFWKTGLHNFLIFLFSREGRSFRKVISDKIRIGNRNFERWVKTDPKKANRYFQDVGANIFILENLSFNLLKNININLDGFERQGFESSMSDISAIDLSFDSFDTSFDVSFDSSFDFGDSGGSD